jgi:lysophospholipase L1-like esterase
LIWVWLLAACLAPAAGPSGVPPFQIRSISEPDEPDWVETFAVGSTSGVPAEKCSGVADLRSPGVRPPGAPAPAPEPPSQTHLDLASFPTVQLPSGAASASADPRMVVRSTQPLDLHAIPIERLRGLPADIDRVRRALLGGTYGKRIVRVGFWGASHVAGEFFTGALRRSLQERYGDGGHGFVMPVGPWKGYRADGVTVCGHGPWINEFDRRAGGRGDGLLGPGGMSVESDSPEAYGWVQTRGDAEVRRFEVLFLRQPSGGTLRVQIDDAMPVELSTRGAIGPGAAVFRVRSGGHRLRVAPVGDGPVRLLGVNMENDRPGFVVDAMGVNGRTVSSWRRWNAELFASFEKRRPHDLIALAYGTNEANDANFTPEEYQKSLETSLERVRSLFPDTPCVLIGPADRAKKLAGGKFAVWEPNTQVAAIQRSMGPKYGCATWDLQGAMGGPGSALSWWSAEPRLMSDDLIHLSPLGYSELGRRLLAEVEGVAELR